MSARLQYGGIGAILILWLFSILPFQGVFHLAGVHLTPSDIGPWLSLCGVDCHPALSVASFDLKLLKASGALPAG
jgi:hypothetical protein